MRFPTLVFGLMGLAAFGASCSDDPAPTPADASVHGDASSDIASDIARDQSPADVPAVTCTPRMFESGSADGNATPLTVPAGAVRGGRLNAANLPTDRTGLSYLKAGDFVLANERVALMIESARPSSGYDPWGGKPVGVARMEGGRLVDAGDFNEMMVGLGRFTVATESVTVLNDGTRDNVAVVRAVGPMRAIPFIDEFGRTIIRANYDDVRAAIDYELRPGNDYVDVFATYDVQNPDGYNAQFTTHAFFQGYRMSRYFPGYGFLDTGGDAAPPTSRTVGWIDDEGTSWAWQIPTGMLTQFISVSGFDLFNAPPMMLPGCATTPERRPLGRIVIGGGRGLDGLQQSLARMNNQRLRELRGTVTDSAGMPATGVRVHASATRMVPGGDGGTTTLQEELSRATTDAMGAFTLHVPEGMAVDLTAFRRGDAVVGPTSVPATQAMATLRLAATGNIHVVATEMGSTTGLPVRVQVLPTGGATLPSVPDSFGEPHMLNGRLHVEFPTTGDITLRAPPGAWRVVVSRGYEYDLSDTMVTVTAGMTADVRATLRRVVDTTGVQCGDFHIHTTRSPDSRDSGRYKLASAAADGLEVAARSDHEFVAEWASVVRDMGLDRWMFGLTSLELTTFVWGHFGVFPLEVDAARPNGGIFEWANRPPPMVFADVRARREQPTMVINHPRATSMGYFASAGYNPATGTALRPDLWDDRFTAVEVFNDTSLYNADNCANVRDWFSFLDRNRHIAAVGSSDSHTILGGSPVGYPRTCMYLGNDDPRMATPTGIRDAVANGRSFVSGGVYVDASVMTPTGAVGPGQDARGVGAMARVQVRVQAAPWITVDRLQVFTNGPISMASACDVAGTPSFSGATTVQTLTLDASTRDPANPVVRYRGEVTVPVPAEGAWVVVAARGGSLDPVHPGRNAFGITNAIWLQR